MENQDIIKPQDILGIHTKVLRKSTGVRKTLISFLVIKEQNGGLISNSGFAVYDKFDKEVFRTEHIALAVRTYNNLQ